MTFFDCSNCETFPPKWLFIFFLLLSILATWFSHIPVAFFVDSLIDCLNDFRESKSLTDGLNIHERWLSSTNPNRSPWEGIFIFWVKLYSEMRLSKMWHVWRHSINKIKAASTKSPFKVHASKWIFIDFRSVDVLWVNPIRSLQSDRSSFLVDLSAALGIAMVRFVEEFESTLNVRSDEAFQEFRGMKPVECGIYKTNDKQFRKPELRCRRKVLIKFIEVIHHFEWDDEETLTTMTTMTTTMKIPWVERDFQFIIHQINGGTLFNGNTFHGIHAIWDRLENGIRINGHGICWWMETHCIGWMNVISIMHSVLWELRCT